MRHLESLEKKFSDNLISLTGCPDLIQSLKVCQPTMTVDYDKIVYAKGQKEDQCLCGHKLHDLYYIYNTTKDEYYVVGSDCYQKCGEDYQATLKKITAKRKLEEKIEQLKCLKTKVDSTILKCLKIWQPKDAQWSKFYFGKSRFPMAKSLKKYLILSDFGMKEDEIRTMIDKECPYDSRAIYNFLDSAQEVRKYAETNKCDFFSKWLDFARKVVAMREKNEFTGGRQLADNPLKYVKSCLLYSFIPNN